MPVPVTYEQIVQIGTVSTTLAGTSWFPLDGADSITFRITAANIFGPRTAHAVLIGEGNSAFGAATVGTSGRMLLDQGGSADPAFEAMSGDATLAGTGAITLTSVGTAGTYGQVTTDAQGRVTAGATCDVSHGGTGATTLTAHAVLLGEGTSAVGTVAVGVPGRLLVDQGAADPVFRVMIGDALLSSAGTLTLATVNSNVGTWNSVTVNAKGLVTAASNTSLTVTAPITSSGSGGSQTISLTTPLAIAYGGTNSTITLNNSRVMQSSGGQIIEMGAFADTLNFVGSTTGGTAPQINKLIAGSNVTITRSSDSITIASSSSGGTVTSVDVKGGTTGLTSSGGPITSSGTITLAGTLVVANGGTGATTLTANSVLLGEGTSAVGSATIGTAGRMLLDQGAATDPAFKLMTGDATLSSAAALTLATVGTAGTYGQVTVNAKGLTTSGTVITDIAHGGTNSSTTLNNSRVMNSSAGAIVEMGAFADTLNFVGSTTAGTAPQINKLVAGSNITITRSSDSVTVAGTGAVSSVNNNDGTLTVSPTTGSVTASLALAHVNAWTGQQNFGTASLTDSATITWNCATQQVASVTLAGNRTLANPTNMVDGGTYILRIGQDTVGSRTLAYGSAYKWPGATSFTLSTAASALDILTFTSNGSAMYGVGQKGFA